MFNLRKYANIFNPYKYIKKYLYHKKQNFYYQKAMDHNQRVQERKSVGYLPSKKALRTIKTIRSVDSVNYNINGYKPLIKKLIPSEMFILLHTVIRYKNTGRIEYVADTSGSWWDMGATHADSFGHFAVFKQNFPNTNRLAVRNKNGWVSEWVRPEPTPA